MIFISLFTGCNQDTNETASQALSREFSFSALTNPREDIKCNKCSQKHPTDPYVHIPEGWVQCQYCGMVESDLVELNGKSMCGDSCRQSCRERIMRRFNNLYDYLKTIDGLEKQLEVLKTLAEKKIIASSDGLADCLKKGHSLDMKKPVQESSWEVFPNPNFMSKEEIDKTIFHKKRSLYYLCLCCNTTVRVKEQLYIERPLPKH